MATTKKTTAETETATASATPPAVNFETAVATVTNNVPAPLSPLMARLYKQQEARAVKEKTCSIGDLFKMNAHSRKYNEEGRVVLPVHAIMAKYIQKYDKGGENANRGYLVSLTTTDGELFTTFSGAFIRWFESMLEMYGQPLEEMGLLKFWGDAEMSQPASIELTITEKTFPKANTATGQIENLKTYNLEVTGGNAYKVSYLGTGASGTLSDSIIIE